MIATRRVVATVSENAIHDEDGVPGMVSALRGKQ
jgi:hypothetical protein